MIIMILFWLIAIIVGLVVIVLIMAAMKPDAFRYERRTTINAVPEKIFPLLNDFHTWVDWSPWEKLDPTMKKTFTGTPTGKGAVYEWLSTDKKVGAGRMEILETVPASALKIKLDFIKPFAAHNVIDFTLQPSGTSTVVIWAMSGPSPLLSKVMGLFMNMDKLIGKDFETGLANLKKLAEK